MVSIVQTSSLATANDLLDTSTMVIRSSFAPPLMLTLSMALYHHPRVTLLPLVRTNIVLPHLLRYDVIHLFLCIIAFG